MKINKRTLFENNNIYGVSGVYAITNKVTKERYIGSSNDIRMRWHQHTCPSSWKQQPNNPLYLDMQKYGVENFTFTIVALVTEEHLRDVEQSAMKMLNHEYNTFRAYVTDDERKEYHKAYIKEYRKSEKGKEYNRKQARKCKMKYNNQLCFYKGETLTLNTLSARFLRLGIAHPTKEAKKYLIQQKNEEK